MSQKKKSQLQGQLKKLQEQKSKFEAVKEQQPDKWTDALQAKYDECIGDLADVEEELVDLEAEEAKAKAAEEAKAKAAEEAAKAKAAEEAAKAVKEAAEAARAAEEAAKAAAKSKFIELLIVRGRRFNSSTGKEISHPYKQCFSKGEFRIFASNHKHLGFTILEVINDPWGLTKSLGL